ncbi:MAG TPA: aminopeptidase [Gammaproteobacteria bacterium]|nr:aminopeptidase [Gammaproteobacteria bacterium]
MNRIGKAIVCCALAVATTGCAATYYWQAIGGQIELLRKREPIEEVIADPAVDAKLKTTLARVETMRRFAVDELLLPSNDSYTTYVELDRPYVVWNVVATEEFSVEPRRWCFPFAGCVAYRGYFDKAGAERFAANLAEDGLDTYSGGSTAYSTLGYFDDPVLSSMVAGGDQYVASLLFHELAHQLLYVKSDSEFSEAFAMVVEEIGTERWLSAHGTPADLARYRTRRQRREQFGELISAQQARLRALYASGAPPEQLRADKQRAFETLRREYEALKTTWDGNTDYDAWFAQPLNNAALASVATYTRWLPAMRARLDEVGLRAFYADAAAIAELDEEQRAERLRAWEAKAGPPPSSGDISASG